MRLLLDSCIWKGPKGFLDSAGHDIKWIGDFTSDPGDEIILSIANKESRILITLDKEFGELAILYRKPHSGIIRLVGFSVLQQGNICVKIIEKYANELQSGAIVTVDKTRVRILSMAY